MIPLYVSNGAYLTRLNGRNFRLIPSVAPRLHADGGEFLMYESWDGEIDSIRRLLRESGLSFPVTHADKIIGDILAERGRAGKDDAVKTFRRDLDTAVTLGSDKMVCHLWNGPCSDRSFDETLPIYAILHNMAKDSGVTLTMENVTCVSNLALDHLAAAAEYIPDARFTYDTKMAFLHGENALLATDKYRFLLEKGYITHLHLNDSSLNMPMAGRLPIMHIGDGEVDFGAFFRLLKACNFAGTATVESTSLFPDGQINLDKLNRSLDAVRRGLDYVSGSAEEYEG